MGIRIAVISDKSPSRVGPAVKRPHREAKLAGREVTRVGLSEGDILFYLDEQVCRNDAPGFPGWHAAYDAYRSAPRRDRKDKTWKKVGVGNLPPRTVPREHPPTRRRVQTARTRARRADTKDQAAHSSRCWHTDKHEHPHQLI